MTMPETPGNGSEHVWPEDDVMIAALDMVRRSGALGVQVRYSDDEEPVVWIVGAEFLVGPSGRPVAADGEAWFEVAAALNPTRAALRLCERLVDGGLCLHCHRPAGFEPDCIEEMPADQSICWYQYDPELKVFRRGCEGSAS